MKKLCFLILFIWIAFSVTEVKAQFLNDITGVPITKKKHEDVHGSPFLNDNWLPGTVKLQKGATYKDNVFLKYDLLEDQLYFKGKNGDPLLFVDPVAEFTIGEKHYKNGFKNIDAYTDKTFFELLADGSAQLLKKSKKTIIESKTYNSASVDKNITDINQYFLSNAGKVIVVKKDKKSLLTALGTKQPELEAYIKTNNLNLKNDADMAKLVTYYNSI